MKYLVTGAAGFIGMYTAKRLLELGHQVIGLDNLNRENLQKTNTLNPEPAIKMSDNDLNRDSCDITKLWYLLSWEK